MYFIMFFQFIAIYRNDPKYSDRPVRTNSRLKSDCRECVVYSDFHEDPVQTALLSVRSDRLPYVNITVTAHILDN